MAHRVAARGVGDLDPLSPRDANAQRMPKPAEVKTKTAAQLRSAKDKDHPPPPPQEVREPPSFDRPDGCSYQVGKMLGKGGFAICYSGYQMPSKKKFALKIVKSRMPSKMEQKFQTELQIHSKMRHKNIVQFFRAFSFDKCTYLVLEICPNASLMEMVKKRKGLTEPEVRFYSVQIAGAIKYMHGKGIIHRDLKMGNIFLDQQMNAKIGDFGLAALLVTGKDMQKIRRTTLCGTPNYIAPEILQKDKKGHDHMVDIWSLGIIMFAMFTSKPPFQSSTTDEIYRRARDRDYEWPAPETTGKYISEEAKDLVSTMLADATQRPEPDAIIEHPFFRIGYMPDESQMTAMLRELPPERPEFYASRLSSSMQAKSLQNLKAMCQECCIGLWSAVQVIHTPIWKEMAAEEQAGLTPGIPLAEDIVYRPYEETIREQFQMQAKQPVKVSTYALTTEEGHAVTSTKAPTGLLRQPPQSFAAQQRAQNRPATISTQTKPARTGLETAFSASQTVRARSRNDVVPATVPVESTESGLKSVRISTRSALPTSRSNNALAASVNSSSSTSSSGLAAIRPNSASIRGTTLFSPSEQPQAIAVTKPDLILERLKGLQTELERALNSRSMAIVSSRTVTPPHPHIVVKWVDYTNKFGLGYILNDGSIGCVLRDIPTTEGSKTAILPPAGIFIRNAESHIMRRQDPSYDDRNQPIPMTEPIKFFENNGEAGLSEALISPEDFRVALQPDGTAGKMNPGKDIYQHRKRERVILWKKFANYMIAYGRDEAVPGDESEAAGTMSPGMKGTQAELVTFYQRFGDVGCWAFCDGHLQFNFPDHTKIVINSTGTWCHFWHLPEEAADRLAQTGTIGATALDDRAMLSYPLQTLLNFQSKSTVSRSSTRKRPEIDPSLQGIPAANDFRRKIEFIKNVVKEWVTHGGIGNSASKNGSRLRWLGHRETATVTEPQKQVWVTIGARGGDSRVSLYVDPRKPWELGEER